MKKFRAADGRKCLMKMSEEQKEEQELVNLTAVLAPILCIVLFAFCSGLL